MYLVSMRTTGVVLVALLLSLTSPSLALAGTSSEKDARFAQRVKTEIAKLGTGPEILKLSAKR